MPLARNLTLRNGIYYYRQQINGKRIYKSLNTSDPYLAHYLLGQILKNKICIQQPQNPSIDFRLPALITSNQPVQTQDTAEHNIVEVWDNLQHNCKTPQALKKNRSYILRAVELLGVKYIEALDAQPELIYDMLDKFRKSTIQTGGHKGETLSIKTIKRYTMPLRQVINYANDMEWIENAHKLLKFLELKRIKGFKGSVRREPLAEPDLEKLFRTLYKMLQSDTDEFIHKKCKLQSQDHSKLTTITQYPVQISYAILLCLFTGSRACAITTLRHWDTDLTNKTITIAQNKELVAKGDIREKHKHLKTADSERKLPIANVLIELGIIDYLIRHRAKYGNEAFIFEDVIINKNRQEYRPRQINEAVNTLFKILEIKPQTNDLLLLDMHSLKESFYSYNDSNVSKDMLEAIAGNKPSGRGISSRVYNKQSFDRLPMKMIHAVNLITYPHLNLLFGGQLPDNLKHLEYDYKASQIN